MKLKELLHRAKIDFKDRLDPLFLELPINKIVYDSRLVGPFDLFIAIPCEQVFHNVSDAIQRGVQVLVGDEQVVNFVAINFPGKVLTIAVVNPRHSLSKLSEAYYQSQPENLVAVTGTNGKSSVVHFFAQWSKLMGYKSASLGTLGLSTSVPFEGGGLPKLTTPDAVNFHETLSALENQGFTHVALEASSHGLDQFRIHGAHLKAAGFTNLTQDHLDYHGTMENYFAAKSKLFFEVLPEGGTAVINHKSTYRGQLETICRVRKQKIIGYSLQGEGELVASALMFDNTGINFDLSFEGQNYEGLRVNLVGAFQLENVLCALGLLLACGENIGTLIPHLQNLSPVKGRMDFIGRHRGGSLFVDYAHTPDALLSVLKSLRHHCTSKLHLVFGCGGDRDTSKRPEMGRIAQELADCVYITDDNPRFENPEKIRHDIAKACPKGKIIGDRKEAIVTALAEICPGDILVVAGKGHEDGQIVGSETLPFNDGDVIKSLIN
jgi:UDP-N-acetylmuramoyl-L-alanyl-D-glutamate--2,6-diaminopimelate ligase